MRRLPFKPSKETSAQLVTMMVAIMIGLLGAGGAICFRFLIKLAHYAFFRTDSYTLEWVQTFPIWERLMLPVAGGLLVGPIIFYLANEVRGSGIPEVMEATAFRGGAIRHRVILVKMLAAAITIGSGGSAGREGPIVQIGSSIGSTLGQLLHVYGGLHPEYRDCQLVMSGVDVYYAAGKKRHQYSPRERCQSPEKHHCARHLHDGHDDSEC